MIEEQLQDDKNLENNDISISNENKAGYKRKRVIIPAFLALAGIFLGIHYYNYATTHVSTDDAYIEGHSVQISPKISGAVSKVYIDDNQYVKKGQLLAEIDPVDYEVKYDQAVARLQAAVEKQKGASTNLGLTTITSTATADQANSAVESAKAQVKVTDKQISQSKANLAQVNANIASIQAEFNLAQTDYGRYTKLYKKGVVSKQDFDKASANFIAVKAKLNSAQETVASMESALQTAYANKEVAVKSLDQAIGKLKGADTVPQQVSISDSQRKVAVAEIKQLQAAAKQAKLELSYTKIYAPQSGTVTGKSLEEGAYVQIGQPLLAIVPDERWIVANFKETQLNGMKVGQPVSIKVDAYPNKVFKGQVDSIQASTGSKASLFPPENAVGSFVKVVQRVPVKITFAEKADSQYAIVPGMSVIPEVKVK